MSFRLSKHEAALRAIQLARECIGRLPANNWEWECGDAVPHPRDPDRRGRKVPRRWIVLVRWSRNGAVVDGPGTVVVDVAGGTAELQVDP
jgi:hypothetical protein